MKLPNLSYMTTVGELRYIQSRWEIPQDRNPDALVGEFLTLRQRLGCLVRGKFFKSRLRKRPFYYYVLARTRYYDELFLKAAGGAFNCIINIGCGTDTRSYRFARELKQSGVLVVECDQPQAIAAKQRIAGRHWSTGHVRYMPLELEGASWPDFERLLDDRRHAPVLVMLEGVTPYVGRKSFEAFFGLLARKLGPRSLVAYDFKLTGAAGSFVDTPGVQDPFRLPAGRSEVAAAHDRLGFRLEHMELSTALTGRLVPQARDWFDEDCLVQITPRDASSR